MIWSLVGNSLVFLAHTAVSVNSVLDYVPGLQSHERQEAHCPHAAQPNKLADVGVATLMLYAVCRIF
jgi:hypothetical protein